MSILNPRTATIPIYQGDDAERLSELRMKVAIAEQHAAQLRDRYQLARDAAASARYGDDYGVTSDDVAKAEAAAQAARDEFDAQVDEAADRALGVKVRHIGSRRFRDLIAEHPPRVEKNEQGDDVTHEDDQPFGVNVETFPLALLSYVDPDDTEVRTVLHPAFKGGKEVREFFEDEVTEGDLEKIWQSAYWLNRMPGSDPKGLRYSPSISETSE